MEKNIEKMIEIINEQKEERKMNISHFGKDKDLRLLMIKKNEKLYVDIEGMKERTPKLDRVIISDMEISKVLFTFIYENV